MINPFWNKSQHRMRAFWRLLLQIVFLAIFLILARFLAYFVGTALYSANWQSSLIFQIGYGLVSIISQTLAMVGSVLLAGRLLDRRRIVDFGFHFKRGWWIDFCFGLALGAGLMTLIFVTEWALGWVSITGTFRVSGMPFALGLLLALIQFLFVGVQEELLFHGYQMRNIAEGLHLPKVSARTAVLAAYLISSIIFGLFHLGNPNMTLVSLLNLMAAGLFLGLGYALTGELAIPIGLHIAWNFFQGNVFGFPVSGTYAGASMLSIRQAGPDLATGALFGPEAGLIGLVALALGSVLIILWVRMGRDKTSLHEALATFQSVPAESQADAEHVDEMEDEPESEMKAETDVELESAPADEWIAEPDPASEPDQPETGADKPDQA